MTANHRLGRRTLLLGAGATAAGLAIPGIAQVGPADVRFAWSGDVAGQGWGINPDVGGMITWAALAARAPDFFIHSGDTVYSDGPLQETVTLPDGRVWHNIVTPAKTKVAET